MFEIVDAMRLLERDQIRNILDTDESDQDDIRPNVARVRDLMAKYKDRKKCAEMYLLEFCKADAAARGRKLGESLEDFITRILGELDRTENLRRANLDALSAETSANRNLRMKLSACYEILGERCVDAKMPQNLN
jgi:hypothetical protein